jgi:hypothetical protein
MARRSNTLAIRPFATRSTVCCDDRAGLQQAVDATAGAFNGS